MKRIRSPEDLAINGAPPAFAEPLHVGRPNIGNKQTFLAFADAMIDRAWLTNNGPLVQAFEERVKQFLGVKHCVAMCNGTIALEIAIRALGLTGEVIVPSYTFIATAHALHWQGITPVFADIDPDTHNLDPESVRRMITPRTTGIIGVHLWGRPSRVEALQAIADEHGLQLMFDAAHAFGCSYGEQMIGNFGRAEVLSFHATKFFNTLEGGAVVTNEDELAEVMRLMRDFGFSGYDNVIHPGTNGKMVEICAAMGLTNFDELEDIVAANQRNHRAYAEFLAVVPGVRLLQYEPSERNNFQYVVVEVTEECQIGRDKIVAALQAENVLARKYFWPGCHRMKPYSDIYPLAAEKLAMTEQIADRVIVLPTGKSVSTHEISVIVDVLGLMA